MQELHDLAVLDTDREEPFDDIVRIASYVCGTPMSLVSLVAGDRQWFKAQKGIAGREAPRDVSFCGHAIVGRDVFVVSDARHDDRFADNPNVTGDPYIRFYAGAPLVTAAGRAVGTLCVLDRTPRQLTPEQLDILQALARRTTALLERRRQVRELQRLMAERDRADSALRDAARRFEQILNALPVGVFVIDRTGRPTFANSCSQELLGRGIVETRTGGLAETYRAIEAGTGQPYPAERMPIVAALDGAETVVDDMVIDRPAGPVLLQVSGTPVRGEGGDIVGAAAVFRDVTQQRRAEESLRRSESRSRSIIENMHGGLVTVDAAGRIESLNPAACRIFGYDAASVVGTPLETLIPSRSAAAVLDVLRAAVRTSSLVEWEGRRHDGELFPIELTMFAFETATGNHWALNSLDVSVRREVERLKKEFVSTVSHELRTPLTSIRGSLGLLASGVLGELAADAQEVVSIAERNALRLIGLINDILDLEGLETGKMELRPRDEAAAALIARACESVHGLAVKLGVGLDARPTPARVWADGDRLVQVLVNLLSNAVKFSTPGGSVTVEAEEQGEWVTFRVTDRGRGIPRSHLDAIFERFRQVEASDAREKGGTGLGLPICRSIVERHGGTIGVDSEEGVGSTFWFRLPACPAAPPHEVVDADARSAAVLLVEDDPSLVEVLVRQLRNAGIPVRSVGNAGEAIAMARAARPALLVLDIGLSEGNGFDVVEALRADGWLKDTPVLVYTGRDLNDAERRRLTLGPTRFLIKTTHSDAEFRRTVEELMSIPGTPAGGQT